ncbi:MAG: hypothetical protein ACJAWS_001819 [Oleiphilaceae bacterium]|jgi:hypothetical protein
MLIKIKSYSNIAVKVIICIDTGVSTQDNIGLIYIKVYPRLQR